MRNGEFWARIDTALKKDTALLRDDIVALFAI